jgi:hypothetical protein
VSVSADEWSSISSALRRAGTVITVQSKRWPTIHPNGLRVVYKMNRHHSRRVRNSSKEPEYYWCHARDGYPVLGVGKVFDVFKLDQR